MFKKENLRRNFLRVKQNIDQNLGRAEKSEVLSEDQQENEKRVDVVKHAFQNIAKKAGVILQTTGIEYDKRLKKLPETNLGHSMLESAQALGPETLLGSVCQLCGDCQINLAREHVQYELTVEQEFVTPIQNVVDVDIPSIIKLRKNLNKSTLDMDSAKSRFNQAVRQSHVPGANMANAAAKADVIREEFEDASQKVENIKDNLSIELCNFAAKESEHSNRLLLLLEAQAEFHRKALEAIEDCIPQMKVAIQNSPAKPCYGMPLEEHLRLMCRDIALVLEACVLTLLEMGMEEEGLFRIAGAAIKLKKLKASFDANAVDMEEFSSDPHTVAGALKQYLRELPEPLLTYSLYDEFMQAASLPQDQRLQTLWTVINKLPKANYNNFRYLIKFLSKLAERSDVNKMKPSNIAIVIGPNLMWTEKSNAPSMLTTGTVSAITEAIVTHADWFFPGAFDFHLIGYGSSPVKCREPGFPLESKTAMEHRSVAPSFGKSADDGDWPAKLDRERQVSRESKIPRNKGMSEAARARSPQKSYEAEDSSSDESNPFSSKFEARSVGENTGDYDNILYTSDGAAPYNLSTSTPHSGDASPHNPSWPSRLTKKLNFFSPSRMEDVKSLEHSYHSPSSSHTLDRSAAGSTPNITSLNRSTSDAHLFSEPPNWNRPNQKSNLSSLKRGSEPCLSLPSANFNSTSHQRPLRVSRSQLGAPPKHVDSSRSLAQMPEDVPFVALDSRETPFVNLYPQVTPKAGHRPDYSTQMRAMYDHQQVLGRHPTETVTLRDLAMSDSNKTHRNRAGPDAHQQNFVQNPGFVAVSPDQKPLRQIGSKTEELDFTNVGYHYEEDQMVGGPQTPVNSSLPHSNDTQVLHVLVSPSQGVAQFSSPGVSPVASTTVPSDSPNMTSPIQRRATRKPAPPPPPERPFNVVVTATSNSSSPAGIVSVPGEATQPNKSAPLASPELSSEAQHAPAFPDRDRHRMSFHGDRPSVPPPDKPDRPRLPPLLNPPPVAIKGHQRSSSTGAVMHQPSSSVESFTGVPNAGSLYFPPVVEGDNPGVGFDSANSVPAGSSNTLGRHSSLRPRPSPPPPPPPIAKHSEDTKL